MNCRNLCATLACAMTLAGCAIHLPHDRDYDAQQSCEIRCANGSRAESHCVKPQIPACECGPAATAACVHVGPARMPGIS